MVAEDSEPKASVVIVVTAMKAPPQPLPDHWQIGCIQIEHDLRPCHPIRVE